MLLSAGRRPVALHVLALVVALVVSVSPVQAAQAAAPAPPPAVQSVSASASSGSASVSWTPGATDDADRDADGYDVRISAPDGSVLHEATTSPQGIHFVELKGLPRGRDLVATVVAWNEAGRAAATVSAAFDNRYLPSRPERPTVSPANRSLVLRWTHEEERWDGLPATGYRITMVGGRRTRVFEVPASPRRFRVTGLRVGTRYGFHLAARNADGVSSDTVGPVRGRPVGKPGAPAAVRLTPSKRAPAVFVNWRRAPANGARVLRYRVSVGGKTAVVAGDRREVRIPGLEPGRRYRAAVRAVNLAGAGPSRWTDPVRVR